jgi:hypothetical protein
MPCQLCDLLAESPPSVPHNLNVVPLGEIMASDENEDFADSEARLLEPVPTGAAWLAGTAVALMLVAWFLIWLLIYIPRGTIG